MSADLENEIAGKFKNAAIQGFGITRRQLIIKVARICRRLVIKTHFKGRGITGFLKRHPEVTLRTAVGLLTIRARMLNQPVVDSYFRSLCELVTSLELADKPKLIWNIDETGVPLTHRPVKVFAEKG